MAAMVLPGRKRDEAFGPFAMEFDVPTAVCLRSALDGVQPRAALVSLTAEDARLRVHVLGYGELYMTPAQIEGRSQGRGPQGAQHDRLEPESPGERPGLLRERLRRLRPSPRHQAPEQHHAHVSRVSHHATPARQASAASSGSSSRAARAPRALVPAFDDY